MPHYEDLSGQIASARPKQMDLLGADIQRALEDGYLTDMEHAALTREHHRRWVVLNSPASSRFRNETPPRAGRGL